MDEIHICNKEKFRYGTIKEGRKNENELSVGQNKT